jgi:hypothetical protein
MIKSKKYNKRSSKRSGKSSGRVKRTRKYNQKGGSYSDWNPIRGRFHSEGPRGHLGERARLAATETPLPPRRGVILSNTYTPRPEYRRPDRTGRTGRTGRYK